MSLKFDYCPICGHCINIFNNNRKIKCPNCFSDVEFIESTNTQQYYQNKSMEMYNDYFHIHQIFMEEEVSKNPLFNPEKSKLTTVEDRQREIFTKKSENVPKCPICSSTKIHKISSLKRATHAYAFGLFSKTARSQFECENCKHKW